MPSPTSRTLDYLRKNGWTCGIVEKVVPHHFIKQDLFGCIDIIAYRPPIFADGKGMIMGVQSTSSPVAARLAKAKAEPRLRTWLQAGGLFCVIGWVKRGGRGERKTWQARVEMVALEDLP